MGTHPTFDDTGPDASYQPKTTDEGDDTDGGGIVAHVRGKMDQIKSFDAVTFDTPVAAQDGLWCNSAGLATVTVGGEDHTINLPEGPHKMRITNVKASGSTIAAADLKYFTFRTLLFLGLLLGMLVPDYAFAQQTVRGNSTTFGTSADVECATDTGTCTQISLQKRTLTRLTSLIAQFTDTVIGSAPPTTANLLAGVGSGATGGLIKAIKTCDSYGSYDGTGTQNTVVTGVSGRVTYICGHAFTTGATATNLNLVYGDDANCATNEVAMTPVIVMGVNDKYGLNSAVWNGLSAPAGKYVCVQSSGGVTHTTQIMHTQH